MFGNGKAKIRIVGKGTVKLCEAMPGNGRVRIEREAAEYTVEEFINMTKDSFGGKIIQQLADELGMC